MQQERLYTGIFLDPLHHSSTRNSSKVHNNQATCIMTFYEGPIASELRAIILSDCTPQVFYCHSILATYPFYKTKFSAPNLLFDSEMLQRSFWYLARDALKFLGVTSHVIIIQVKLLCCITLYFGWLKIFLNLKLSNNVDMWKKPSQIQWYENKCNCIVKSKLPK